MRVNLIHWMVIHIKMLKRRLIKFFKLNWKLKLMVIVSYLLLGIVRLGILVIPFKYIAPLLGKKNISTTLEVEHAVLRKAKKIGFMVELVSQYTPWESKCLARAITAQLLLRVLKIPSTLYLGMSKDESHKLVAHAWLRCGNLIITGASESENFKSVMHFSSLTNKETVSMQF